jgi:hypothetical protein
MGIGKVTFVRKGLVFSVDGNHDWMLTHAQIPFAWPVEDGRVRFYFSTRDSKNRSTITFIETEVESPQNIVYVHNKQCIDLGRLGTFDDCGVMASWFIRHEDKIYLYYSGWNLGGNVAYRIGIGLAISQDDGVTFKRYSEAPILDRSEFDPCWCAQPCVIKEGDRWKMWYLSCTKWEIIDEHPEPFYNVKYAESDDGIEWTRTGETCLDYDDFTNAIGRPVIFFEDGLYKMYYSYRNAKGYRSDPSRAYRLGLAVSGDSRRFERRNDLFELSGPRGAWESIMNEYCHFYEHGANKYLVYNGNGFGKSGFGFAVAENR